MSTTTNHQVIQPYLFFSGCCEEAVTFYQQANHCAFYPARGKFDSAPGFG